MFVALALLAVTADANFNAGRDFSRGKSDYVIAETGAFAGGNSEGGKGHKDAVGADDLQQLPFMDVFRIDLLIVDDGAQARTGKSDLGLKGIYVGADKHADLLPKRHGENHPVPAERQSQLRACRPVKPVPVH